DGPLLTNVHVSASFSGAGFGARFISWWGSMGGLLRGTLGPAGGTSHTLASGVGVSALDFRGGVGVSDELGRSSVDDAFHPQRRRMVGTDSAARLRTRGTSLEPPEEGALPASTGAGRAGLNFLNK